MKPTILAVDDESQILDLLKIELAQDYDVVTAATAQEAVNMAKEHVPDLILMDILLPDMTGGYVVEELKSINTTQDIPIIFLTALLSKNEENHRGNVHVGEQSYPSVAKPIDPALLLNKIKEQLEARKADLRKKYDHA